MEPGDDGLGLVATAAPPYARTRDDGLTSGMVPEGLLKDTNARNASSINSSRADHRHQRARARAARSDPSGHSIGVGQYLMPLAKSELTSQSHSQLLPAVTSPRALLRQNMRILSQAQTDGLDPVADLRAPATLGHPRTSRQTAGARGWLGLNDAMPDLGMLDVLAQSQQALLPPQPHGSGVHAPPPQPKLKRQASRVLPDSVPPALGIAPLLMESVGSSLGSGEGGEEVDEMDELLPAHLINTRKQRTLSGGVQRMHFLATSLDEASSNQQLVGTGASRSSGVDARHKESWLAVRDAMPAVSLLQRSMPTSTRATSAASVQGTSQASNPQAFTPTHGIRTNPITGSPSGSTPNSSPQVLLPHSGTLADGGGPRAGPTTPHHGAGSLPPGRTGSSGQQAHVGVIRDLDDYELALGDALSQPSAGRLAASGRTGHIHHNPAYAGHPDSMRVPSFKGLAASGAHLAPGLIRSSPQYASEESVRSGMGYTGPQTDGGAGMWASPIAPVSTLGGRGLQKSSSLPHHVAMPEPMPPLEGSSGGKGRKLGTSHTELQRSHSRSSVVSSLLSIFSITRRSDRTAHGSRATASSIAVQPTVLTVRPFTASSTPSIPLRRPPDEAPSAMSQRASLSSQQQHYILSATATVQSNATPSLGLRVQPSVEPVLPLQQDQLHAEVGRPLSAVTDHPAAAALRSDRATRVDMPVASQDRVSPISQVAPSTLKAPRQVQAAHEDASAAVPLTPTPLLGSSRMPHQQLMSMEAYALGSAGSVSLGSPGSPSTPSHIVLQPPTTNSPSSSHAAAGATRTLHRLGSAHSISQDNTRGAEPNAMQPEQLRSPPTPVAAPAAPPPWATQTAGVPATPRPLLTPNTSHRMLSLSTGLLSPMPPAAPRPPDGVQGVAYQRSLRSSGQAASPASPGSDGPGLSGEVSGPSPRGAISMLPDRGSWGGPSNAPRPFLRQVSQGLCNEGGLGPEGSYTRMRLMRSHSPHTYEEAPAVAWAGSVKLGPPAAFTGLLREAAEDMPGTYQ